MAPGSFEALVRAETGALRATVATLTEQLREKQVAFDALNNQLLDEIDANRALQVQNELLESFVFALERDHEKGAILRSRQATQELEKSYEDVRGLKEHQDEILANVEQGIMTIDAAGIINNERSRAADRILGLDPAGRVFYDLIPELLRERTRRHVAACFAANARPSMLARLNPLRECNYVAPDGTKRSLAISFARMTRLKGEVTQLLIVIDDLTVEHMLKAEIEQQARAQAAIVERAYELLTLPPDTVEEMMRDGFDTIAHVDAVYIGELGRARSAEQPDARCERSACDTRTR